VTSSRAARVKISEPYRELLRPQFHFTALKGWINDPNGLVFQDGEYHLFFQHNPTGIKWGNIHWGHAVSRDLVHWEQLEEALAPDRFGLMWSGSAVVDWKNTSGLGTGSQPPIVAVYTATKPWVGKRAVQCIAASNDRGRTLVKYQGNPVLPRIAAVNRDPKVIWHEPTGSWIMALFLDGHDFALFRSPNLREWERIDDVSMPGTGECPDFFELPVDGDTGKKRWIFWAADGMYRLGTFDGRHFAAETEPLRSEFGPNGYAAQTWSDLPPRDGRRIQISWMRGGRYPHMPFNGQMSFPVELTLRSFPEGPRLCRMPVREIELLHRGTRRFDGARLEPGAKFKPGARGDLFDIEADMEFTSNTEELVVYIHGIELRYSARDGVFTCLGRKIPAPTHEGHLELRLLVDRTSLELFVPPGKVSASFCFLPEPRDAPLEFSINGGSAVVSSLAIHELASAGR
jgi:sucrose-6-phosphate hydrolase SacC (GH32 family)